MWLEEITSLQNQKVDYVLMLAKSYMLTEEKMLMI